jgi:hypothetical protein
MPGCPFAERYGMVSKERQMKAMAIAIVNAIYDWT